MLPSREEILAVTWLHLHLFQEPPTQPYVAARLRFEPRELRRRWRASGRESVRLLIAQARLLYAASMVREEDCKVTGAVRCAGYASHSSANRVCRKLTGRTIAACRERNPVSFDSVSLWAAVGELRRVVLAAGPASGASMNGTVELSSVGARPRLGLASERAVVTSLQREPTKDRRGFTVTPHAGPPSDEHASRRELAAGAVPSSMPSPDKMRVP